MGFFVGFVLFMVVGVVMLWCLIVCFFLSVFDEYVIECFYFLVVFVVEVCGDWVVDVLYVD